MSTIQASFTVSADLVDIIARSMYRQSRTPVVTRELIQNAVDAAARRGVKPVIDILIETENDGDLHIAVADNGTGMTADVITGKFLCFGASGKAGQNGSVGGFGLASAAITRNKFWSVRTHNLLAEPVDGHVEITEDEAVEFYDGCKVDVWISQGNWSSWCVQSAVMFATLSSYPAGSHVNLTVKTSFNNFQADVSNTAADFLADARPPESLKPTGGWSALVSAKPINLPGGMSKLAGLSLIRIGGLLMFYKQTTNRKTNIFVELPNTDPRSDDYPLSSSRESLRGSYSVEIDRFIEAQTVDAVTSFRDATRIAPPTRYTADGLLLKSRRLARRQASKMTAQQAEDQEDDEAEDWTVDEYLPADKFLELVRSLMQVDTALAGNEKEYIGDVDAPESVALFIENYTTPKDKRLARLHMKIMDAWRDIVSVVSLDDSYGLGFTTESHAARTTENGTTFFLIDPDRLLTDFQKISTTRGRFMRLVAMAAHEAAHAVSSQHNEMFALALDETFVECADDLDSLYATVRNSLDF